MNKPCALRNSLFLKPRFFPYIRCKKSVAYRIIFWVVHNTLSLSKADPVKRVLYSTHTHLVPTLYVSVILSVYIRKILILLFLPKPKKITFLAFNYGEISSAETRVPHIYYCFFCSAVVPYFPFFSQRVGNRATHWMTSPFYAQLQYSKEEQKLCCLLLFALLYFSLWLSAVNKEPTATALHCNSASK